MAKQIFDFTTNPTPARTNIVLVEPVDGSATYKMDIAAIAGLVTKSDVGLGNVENTALSTWAGTANIATVGTITVGTWQGTAIDDAYIAGATDWNAAYNAVATPGDFLRYAGGDLHAVAGTKTHNLLINGDFVISQVLTTFTSATVIPNNDDRYLIDMWNLISDGNDACDVYQETTDVPTNGRTAIKLESETVNKQFGIVQFVEQKRAKQVIGGDVSLSFKIKGSGLAKVRYAVLSWTGTADTLTSDVVGTWAGGGTEPTWAASWTREAIGDVVSMASWTTVQEADIAIDTASTKNIAVVFWVDDTTISLNDYFMVTDVKLEPGDKCSPWVAGDINAELQECERFRQACAITAMKANSASNCQTTLDHRSLRAAPTSIYASAALAITDATAADYTQSSPDVNNIHEAMQRTSRVDCALFSGMSSGVVMVPRGTGGTVFAEAYL